MHTANRYASQQRQTTRLMRSGLCAGLLILAADVNGAFDYTLTLEGVTSDKLGALGFSHALSPTPVGPATHGELRVDKSSDRVTPLLMARLCGAQPLPRVRIEAKETTPDHVRYYAIQLSDVFVTSFGVAATNAADTPIESVSFNYGRIEWTYIQTDASGLPGSATSTLWDLFDNAGGASDPDSDGDGMPDSYEVGQMLKPLTDDADQDSDMDGMSNINEYLSGTAAGDPTSLFQVVGFDVLTAGGAACTTVTFSSVPGRVYDLYALPSLTSALPPAPTKTVTATASTTSVNLLVAGFQAFVRVEVRVP